MCLGFGSDVRITSRCHDGDDNDDDDDLFHET